MSLQLLKFLKMWELWLAYCLRSYNRDTLTHEPTRPTNTCPLCSQAQLDSLGSPFLTEDYSDLFLLSFTFSISSFPLAHLPLPYICTYYSNLKNKNVRFWSLTPFQCSTLFFIPHMCYLYFLISHSIYNSLPFSKLYWKYLLFYPLH